jgi:hypothetical protein
MQENFDVSTLRPALRDYGGRAAFDVGCLLARQRSWMFVWKNPRGARRSGRIALQGYEMTKPRKASPRG